MATNSPKLPPMGQSSSNCTTCETVVTVSVLAQSRGKMNEAFFNDIWQCLVDANLQCHARSGQISQAFARSGDLPLFQPKRIGHKLHGVCVSCHICACSWMLCMPQMSFLPLNPQSFIHVRALFLDPLRASQMRQGGGYLMSPGLTGCVGAGCYDVWMDCYWKRAAAISLSPLTLPPQAAAPIGLSPTSTPTSTHYPGWRTCHAREWATRHRYTHYGRVGSGPGVGGTHDALVLLEVCRESFEAHETVIGCKCEGRKWWRMIGPVVQLETRPCALLESAHPLHPKLRHF